jgi:hypothetical protein
VRELALPAKAEAPTVTIYVFHPRSDCRGYDLLSGNRNLGTLCVGYCELAIEYAKSFSRLLSAEIRVIAKGASD